MNLRRYTKRHNHTDLIRHARRVARFGGRENQDAKVKNAILNANLGGSHVYNTTAAVPSEKVVVLCEMSLPRAIPVDLVFSLPNRRIDPDGGARLADDPPTDNFDSLDVGSGFVRITWGSNGGQVQSVDVDAGKGWRYPFIASYVSMAYHPVDRTQFVGTPSKTNSPMIGLQARDLIVSGSIVPGHSVAPVLPLTKTMYYPQIPLTSIARMPIPNFATVGVLNMSLVTSSISLVGEYEDSSGQGLGGIRPNSIAQQWPSWTMSTPTSVPSKAVVFRIIAGSASNLDAVTMRYRLAI